MIKDSIFIFIILFSVIFVSSCSQNKNKQESKMLPVADSSEVFILQRLQVNKQITFPAELSPLERAEIFAKVSGYISSLKVDIGDHVRKGQLLATLEAPEMIANYAQVNADVQSSRSKYMGSLDAYKRILDASKVEGTIAAGELEKAKSQMMADSASMDALRSKLNAYSQLKDYLIIRSPFDGVITERNVDMGTLVGANNSKPILVVEDINTLRLRLPIPEAYTSATLDGSFVNFTVDAQPNVTYKAKLSRKAGALNLVNRTETWEFLYINNGQLKSGMFANAVINLKRKDPSFLVPSSAVVTNLEKRFVIQLKNGKAQWVDVRAGMTANDKMEIFGNLNEGDTLLVRATDEIKQGTHLVPSQNR